MFKKALLTSALLAAGSYSGTKYCDVLPGKEQDKLSVANFKKAVRAKAKKKVARASKKANRKK